MLGNLQFFNLYFLPSLCRLPFVGQTRKSANNFSFCFDSFPYFYCGSRTREPSSCLVQPQLRAQIIKQNNNFRKERAACRNKTGMEVEDPSAVGDEDEVKDEDEHDKLCKTKDTLCKGIYTRTYIHVMGKGKILDRGTNRFYVHW